MILRNKNSPEVVRKFDRMLEYQFSQNELGKKITNVNFTLFGKV